MRRELLRQAFVRLVVLRGDDQPARILVDAMDDAALIDSLRGLDLDLAIDLKGHTQDARFEVFHQRIAPVQVNYLGHPGTTGSASMDFILGDAVVTPLDHQPFYSETIWQLPGCYQANTRLAPDDLPPPSFRVRESVEQLQVTHAAPGKGGSRSRFGSLGSLVTPAQARHFVCKNYLGLIDLAALQRLKPGHLV